MEMTIKTLLTNLERDLHDCIREGDKLYHRRSALQEKEKRLRIAISEIEGRVS